MGRNQLADQRSGPPDRKAGKQGAECDIDGGQWTVVSRARTRGLGARPRVLKQRSHLFCGFYFWHERREVDEVSKKQRYVREVTPEARSREKQLDLFLINRSCRILRYTGPKRSQLLTPGSVQTNSFSSSSNRALPINLVR
ncbi:hypothetical protein THAOC_00857 [Thalassiosira oceanica]|uniref:Uncharacterized protein n=1 Tax=Thalassiosira oceanica TaxID=159749 RepID=K0TF09_THAOC|nr:hypothetical protein THAOC_00857 [Thalassiosira oceanica]|eukprot:EJK77318.1 hypothetical protein THAOC_00857 [Thalassiosira oceanica]